MQLFQIKINDKQSVKGISYSSIITGKTVIITSGAGVLQSFYQTLSPFIQSNGISVIAFEYSGAGKSLYGNNKQENSSLSNWGSRDFEAVFKYTMVTHPGHEIILLGHSMGGQLIRLAQSARLPDKIIHGAAQTGYWKFGVRVSKIRLWLNWYLPGLEILRY